MQVVGMTNEQEVWAASGERKFRLNELLVIQDDSIHDPIGEVVETYAVNPFIPSVEEKSPVLVDSKVLKTLGTLGYEIDKEMIYLARVRILSDLYYPVRTGAGIREPEFDEVRELLIRSEPERGLTIGVIQGTEGLNKSLPAELSDIAPLFDGKTIIAQTGVPFILDYRAMSSYPHLGIFGGSGSGKSFGLRVIIEELMVKRVPMIIFDPHYEMNFSEPFAASLADDTSGNFDRFCVTVTVGSDVGVRFDSLGTGDLCNLLDAVSPITEAMENAVASLLDVRDSLSLFIDRLNSLISLLESPAEEVYKQEFMERKDIENKRKGKYWNKLLALRKQVGQLSTLKSINWRLNRLVRQGIFMDQGINRIEEGLRSQKAVIVRGSIWMLKVYAAYVLRSVYNKRRDYRDALQKGVEVKDKFPPFIVITDEAHNFAPRGEHNVPARREIREIAQEGRKYGVFLLLASQRPALLDDTVNAQLNTKIIFRTVRSTDLAVIREETDIGSEEINRLPYLPSGTGYVSSPVFGRTMPVRIRAAKTRSPHQVNPFDELEDMAQPGQEVTEMIKACLPINESNLIDILSRLEEIGVLISTGEIVNILEQMVASGSLRREENPLLGYTYHALDRN